MRIPAAGIQIVAKLSVRRSHRRGAPVGEPAMCKETGKEAGGKKLGPGRSE